MTGTPLVRATMLTYYILRCRPGTSRFRSGAAFVMPYTRTVVDGRTVILDENGRPCRSCNSLEDFQALMGATGSRPSNAGSLFLQAESASQMPQSYRSDPPDSAQLGNNTWTFLHSMAANYPSNPTPSQQQEMTAFIDTFSRYYPCQPCAEDFREWVSLHRPEVSGRQELSNWFCNAHNAVNTKLGKPEFDCANWRARWRDGWQS